MVVGVALTVAVANRLR
uniref:Uncharacterized protein n=1 Tax=Oryza meridionalis TaxID=40149 RepID=A0A0E0F4G8_9ORYZ